jgi:hypothetical protein
MAPGYRRQHMKKTAALFLVIFLSLGLSGTAWAGVVKKNAAKGAGNPPAKEGSVSTAPEAPDGGNKEQAGTDKKTEERLTEVTEGIYTLFVKQDDGGKKFLAVAADSANNEANIQVAEQSGTAGEEFYLKPDADGSFQIVNVNSGKVLDITRGNISNGNNIQQYSFVGYPDQLWYFRPFDDGWKIVSRASVVWGLSERVLNTNGDNVEIHEFDGSGTQKWYLEKVKTG